MEREPSKWRGVMLRMSRILEIPGNALTSLKSVSKSRDSLAYTISLCEFKNLTTASYVKLNAMSTEQATLADLLKRLELVEAKEAIRDVLYRYARGADRGDIELFKSCYVRLSEKRNLFRVRACAHLPRHLSASLRS